MVSIGDRSGTSERIYSLRLSSVVNADFFFSSRRRHTRSLCDWSSDVCSSDLVLAAHFHLRPRHPRSQLLINLAADGVRAGEREGNDFWIGRQLTPHRAALSDDDVQYALRSEERRVGKECRYRQLVYQ